MYKTTNQRISDAARRYLELKDYEVLDQFEWQDTPFIAAEDLGELVIARVSCSTERVPEPWSDRDMFEQVAAFYLKGCEDADVSVRGDSIDMLVLGESRALLRHTTNCSNGFRGV